MSSLAFAQPVYDLLRRTPEFFAIRELYIGDLLALFVLFAVVPALALAAPLAAVRFLRPSWTRPTAATIVGLLVAVIALQASRGVAGPAALAIALVAWAGAAWTYLRFQGARAFTLVLSAAAVLVPAFLLLDADVRRSAAPPVRSAEVRQADTGARAPIVLVVFDEWSLTSILDRDGAIDRERLPNLAALADTATWYPNATAAADVSELAIPAMLSGQPAEQGRLPTLAEYPVNLFTLLAPSHDLYALEPISSLCPNDVNRLAIPRLPFNERLSLLVSDLAIIWLNLSLPAAWTNGLPPVTQTWSGFGGTGATAPTPPSTDEPVARARFRLRHTDRAMQFRRFIEAIEPNGSSPGFYFLHSLLPHTPWEYLPSGRRYDPKGLPAGLHRNRWAANVTSIRLAQKRHLLQVQFVDRLIGDLLGQLKAVGLFDRSVVAITADHGLAFLPGQPFRLIDPEDPSREQPLDQATVPLVVKAPFQTRSEIDERPLPLNTLAPHLLKRAGAPGDLWPAEAGLAGPSEPVGKYTGSFKLPADRDEWRLARAAAQAEMLGEMNHPYAIGARPDLHGRRTTDLRRRSGDTRFHLADAPLFHNIDPERHVLPALVSGTFDDAADVAGRTVAIALNGIIASTVEPHETVDGRNGLAALLPESHFRRGPNRIDVLLLSDTGGPPEVEFASLPGEPLYELVLGHNGTGQALRRLPSGLDDGREFKLRRQREEDAVGFLDLGPQGEIRGWAVDPGRPDGISEIVAFVDGLWQETAQLTTRRPGVAQRFGQEFMRSGFILSLKRLEPRDRLARQSPEAGVDVSTQGVVVYAISSQGFAFRLRPSYRPLERQPPGAEILPITDGRRMPVQPTGTGFGGAIDLVRKEGRRTVIEGWAADLERGERPRQIVIYRDGEYLASFGANRERPDVSRHHEDDRLLRTGFRNAVSGAPDPATFGERHRVFAIMARGTAVELPLPTSTDEDRAGRH